jgi:hypothetical protein
MLAVGANILLLYHLNSYISHLGFNDLASLGTLFMDLTLALLLGFAKGLTIQPTCF